MDLLLNMENGKLHKLGQKSVRFAGKRGRLNETYETDMPNAITDFELNSTASPDSATAFCFSSTMTIYGGSIYIAAISFLLSKMLHIVIKNQAPIDALFEWNSMQTFFVINSDNGYLYLLNGCRIGGCAKAHRELKPTCQNYGQHLTCLGCVDDEGCKQKILYLKEAPTTTTRRPEWLEVEVESCKKYAAESCPCGWAKCVSDPGCIASGCCPSGYKFECCSYMVLPPSTTENATEEPNTAVTLLTSKMCIALTSLAMTLHFANNQLQQL
ncbi:hypothetical protein niasHT_008999 [Heterodera trifolii]|uniref:Uncharacterized protein n=1 Tax=Heterodera trifolii TaxID=157864 RepID=A0ABD2LY33_9BILA